MNLIKIGKIVNTHGIKGEVRIISDFKYKKDVFKKGNKIYVGIHKEDLIINSYRVHKMFDMVTFNDINDINDVLKYKGLDVFINRDEYEFDGILYEDLIGLDVILDGKIYGIVTSLVHSAAHPIIVITDKEEKEHMVPYIDQFIKDVDIDKNTITIEVIDGLL